MPSSFSLSDQSRSAASESVSEKREDRLQECLQAHNIVSRRSAADAIV